MERQEPLLLINQQEAKAALISNQLNDFLPALNAGVNYNDILQENLLHLPTPRTPIDHQLYTAPITNEEQLRNTWPHANNTYFINPANAVQEAQTVKNRYRKTTIDRLAKESEAADGFFAFLELYAAPLIDNAKTLRTTNAGYTHKHLQPHEEQTTAAAIDATQERLNALKTYVTHINHQPTTDAFLQVLYNLQRPGMNEQRLAQGLLNIAASNRENPPIEEGKEILLADKRTYTLNELLDETHAHNP